MGAAYDAASARFTLEDFATDDHSQPSVGSSGLIAEQSISKQAQ